jgi:penicillin amidase
MRFGRSITEPISLQWTAAEPGRLLESVYDLQSASNWEEFRSALEKWDVPGQNFVYADRDGNIGYQMTGKLPVRKSGTGFVPGSGSDGSADWTGTVPFASMPSSYNPPEGYIATANNKPFSDPELDIPGHWSATWRIDRIVEMLQSKEKLSIEDMEAMLRDTRSPLTAKWQNVLSGLIPEGPEEKQVIEMIKGWDADLKVDSAPAAAYEFIMRRTFTETFADELGQQLFLEYVTSSRNPARALELLLDKPDDPLWDRTDTPEKENRDAILLRALTGSMSDMKTVMGDNMAEWQWGKAHRIMPPHPFGSQPLIGGPFSLSAQGMPGDFSTVAVSGFVLFDPNFVVDLHQSYRMIIDAGDWSNSRALYTTGQSGQPFSRHWGDMYEKWVRFEYNPLLYAQDRISAQQSGVLTLRP